MLFDWEVLTSFDLSVGYTSFGLSIVTFFGNLLLS